MSEGIVTGGGGQAESRPYGHIRIRLWDLPLRIFHWSLVAAVVVAVVTGNLGGDWMVWHGRAGLSILGLLVFRIVWGFVGGAHARFRSFWPRPSNVLAYLRGRWQGVGHNPLGALSVLVLLALLLAQASTGLFSSDDIAFNGPLFDLVDESLAGRLGGWHHRVSNLLLGFLALHVVAILFYLWVKRDNLVKPMVTGWKDVPEGAAVAAPGGVALVFSVLTALAAVVAASGALL